jgi:anti-anti-sigma factor
VDLSGVTFLGSAGLRALVEISDTHDKNHKLYVVADTVVVKRPLDITGLADVIVRYSELDAALTACESPNE